MAQKFRLYRPRRTIFSARLWSHVAFIGVLIVVLFGSYRNQFGELFATYTPPQHKPPMVVYPGGNQAAGPSVIKLDAGRSAAVPAAAPGGLKIIQPDPASTGALDGPKLPTVVKLGPAPALAPAAPIDPSRIVIVDGDTIRVDDRSYRLAGIDTPESGPQAKCAAEREKAARATRRLREIVISGGVRFEQVACACPSGAEGTPACNHGRYCGVLTSAGRDVGQILIGEGLAKRYDCRLGYCPPKQPWC